MIRDFRLRSVRELACLGERLGPVALAWGEQWLAGAPPVVVESVHEARTASPEAPEWVWHTDQERWCGARAEPFSALTAALCGVPPGSVDAGSAGRGLAADLTRRALADLARCLLSERAGESAGCEAGTTLELAPREISEPGSGACEVVVTTCGASLHCVLSLAAVDAWIGRAAPPPRTTQGGLVPLRAAISDCDLRALGVVGFGELPLAALSRLSVGDVIAIDQHVDDPSSLLFPDLAVRCDAYLCERDGRSALLLEAPGVGRPNGSTPTQS